MNLAFLIDPPESLKIGKDTSFALMLEAQRRGHSLFILERGDLSIKDGKLTARARAANVTDDASKPFTLSAYQKQPADYFDILFVRTDPPFNTDYITDTWLLSHAPAGSISGGERQAQAQHTPERPLVLNSPHGLRTINEKIWAAQFSDFTPPTLITSQVAEYRDFLRQHRTVVVKPTDGFGGSAVFMVNAGDKNAAVVFETLQKTSGYVIVQGYIPAASEGDKRILLLNGEVLGAVMRHHRDDDHRNNFAAGGKAQKATITATDRAICAALKPHLLDLGIFFAGIDIIGRKLIEVNVTSPTCLREMQHFYSENLAEKVIVAAEALRSGGVFTSVFSDPAGRAGKLRAKRT
jgi:glutathione synthase